MTADDIDRFPSSTGQHLVAAEGNRRARFRRSDDACRRGGLSVTVESPTA